MPFHCPQRPHATRCNLTIIRVRTEGNDAKRLFLCILSETTPDYYKKQEVYPKRQLQA